MPPYLWKLERRHGTRMDSWFLSKTPTGKLLHSGANAKPSLSLPIQFHCKGNQDKNYRVRKELPGRHCLSSLIGNAAAFRWCSLAVVRHEARMMLVSRRPLKATVRPVKRKIVCWDLGLLIAGLFGLSHQMSIACDKQNMYILPLPK
jgi:hypothetical protein